MKKSSQVFIYFDDLSIVDVELFNLTSRSCFRQKPAFGKCTCDAIKTEVGERGRRKQETRLAKRAKRLGANVEYVERAKTFSTLSMAISSRREFLETIT